MCDRDRLCRVALRLANAASGDSSPEMMRNIFFELVTIGIRLNMADMQELHPVPDFELYWGTYSEQDMRLCMNAEWGVDLIKFRFVIEKDRRTSLFYPSVFVWGLPVEDFNDDEPFDSEDRAKEWCLNYLRGWFVKSMLEVDAQNKGIAKEAKL